MPILIFEYFVLFLDITSEVIHTSSIYSENKSVKQNANHQNHFIVHSTCYSSSAIQ